MQSVAIFYVDINYKNAEELEANTGFSLSSKICEGLRNGSQYNFTINDINFEVDVLPFFDNINLRAGGFNLYVDVKDNVDRSAANTPDIKKQIIDRIKVCINDINEELSKYKIPVDNLENIKFDEDEKLFYQIMCTPTPTIIKVQCTLQEVDDTLVWNF